jgi:hypothetical protein
MPISKLQRKSLQLYLRFQDRSPSLLTLMRLSLPRIVLIATACSLAGTFYYWVDLVFGAGLMLGIFVGFLTAVLGQHLLAVRVWPVFKQVIDWTKVHALLAESE